MNKLAVSTWTNVSEGCPITYSVSGSDTAHLMLGDNQLQLDFEAESMRALVAAATAALTEMDARFAREEAERAGQE